MPKEQPFLLSLLLYLKCCQNDGQGKVSTNENRVHFQTYGIVFLSQFVIGATIAVSDPGFSWGVPTLKVSVQTYYFALFLPKTA